MPRHVLTGVIAAAALLAAGCGLVDDDASDVGPITTSALGDLPTQEPPWSAGPPSGATVLGDDPDEVLVLGDSLVLYSIVGDVAEQVSATTGHDATAVGLSGATWVTYGREGFQTGNQLAGAYAEERDAVLTVIALATNDSRLVTQYEDAYPATEQAAVMAETVDAVLETSECVVLVTVAGRDDIDGMTRAATDVVNANLTALADASDGDVRIADWEAHAADHPEWLTPGDVHFEPAGYAAYRAFIADAAAVALADGC